MKNLNARLYGSTSFNVKPSRFGSHADYPSLTSQLNESDGKGIMSRCSAGLLRRADCCSSHLMDNESRWFERIWWKRHHVKLLCWPPPAGWLLLQPSDGQRKASHSILSSAACQVTPAGLVQRGRCCSSHLIDNESRWFERIWWKRHHVKLLCWPPPAGWLLLQPSDGQRKASHSILSSAACQVTPAGLVQRGRCCSSHLMDNESRWFERIWWKRHHVKLLCWPPPAGWLLLQPSDGQRKASHSILSSAACQVTPAGLVQRGRCCSSHLIDNESRWFERIWWKRHHVKLLLLASSSAGVAAPAIWLTTKAGDLRESDGRGIMSSCSAGLVRHGHCCSRHLMDKGKQVIRFYHLQHVKLLLLASSSAGVAAPAIWWTTKAGDLRESDGRGIMSSCSAGLLRRADCCSSHLMDKGKQVIRFYHLQHVKLLLLAWSSAGVAAPAIWLTTKAGDLRESDGRGIMSSCSAGLVHRDCCCSSRLMDRDYELHKLEWFCFCWSFQVNV